MPKKSWDGIPGLSELAPEIEREADLAEEAWSNGLVHAIRTGELLTEAKGLLPHGEWGIWLAENFCRSVPGRRTRSERTAQVYMQLYRQQKLLDPQSSADLSINAALVAIASKRETKRPRCGRCDAPVAEANGWKRQARKLASLLNEAALVTSFVEAENIWVVDWLDDSGLSPEALRNLGEFCLKAAEHYQPDPSAPVDFDLIRVSADRIGGYVKGRVERAHIPSPLPEKTQVQIEAIVADAEIDALFTRAR